MTTTPVTATRSHRWCRKVIPLLSFFVFVGNLDSLPFWTVHSHFPFRSIRGCKFLPSGSATWRCGLRGYDSRF
jgi:hypothetical protein